MNYKFIKLLLILYIIITFQTNKSYSEIYNLNNSYAERTNLFDKNANNSILNKDSIFYFLFNAHNVRKFENTNLYSGGFNARSPLLFNNINFSFDFAGNLSDVYDEYRLGIGVVSKITKKNNIAMFYNYSKKDLKNINQINYSSLLLASNYEFNKLNAGISLKFNEDNEKEKMKFNNLSLALAYNFSEDYILEIIYNYNFNFKNIFAISNKIILADFIHLNFAYSINPNKIVAAVLLNLNERFSIAINLDKIEQLPYLIKFQLGLKI